MLQTNYYIRDLLNIASNGGECDKTLWIPGNPVGAAEENGTIVLAIPFYKQIVQQDDVFKCPKTEKELFHLAISAFGEEVLRVTIEGNTKHRADSINPLLEFSREFVKTDLQIELDAEVWTIKDTNNNVRALINLKDPEINFWSDLIEPPEEILDISFFPDGIGKRVALSSDDRFFPKRKGSLPLAIIKEKNTITACTLSLHADPSECFAGTGERFSKLDLSGKMVELENQDGQGVNNKRTYKNVPFYLSSRMYGLFLNTHAHCRISFADHSTRAVQLFNDDDCLDAFFLGGDSIERIQYHYRQITGFPKQVPLWSYGIWMSKMTYNSADEIDKIIYQLKDENYPFDVIHIDTGWFRKDWLCEWKFSDKKFPDPKGFIKKHRDDGIRISLWQMPYVAKEAIQCEEAIEHNYIGRSIKILGQSTSNFGVQDYEGTIDFTNPDAVEWYKGLLRELLEMGVACIKTDFGEEIHMDAEYLGMEARLLHNLYTLLYQKAAAEVTKEITGDAIIWARAGWAGCQRYPVHWGGDAAASWDGMAGSLKGALHLGLSGFAYWSSDIPGFHGVPDFMNSVIADELYVRWTQFSVFSSHMRYHGTSDREPWHFPKVEQIIKAWWKIRYALIPYLQRLGEEVSQSGNPFIRALIFEHPDDKTCWNIDDEYYLGKDILVAPILNSEGIRDVYLPNGEWVDFFDGKIVKGPIWLKSLEVPLYKIPVWIKKDADIPLYPFPVKNTDQMDMEKIIYVKANESFSGIKDLIGELFYKKPLMNQRN